ncbi:DUF7017 domain-containing protein [Thiothrix winogradskyi]|uniref:Tetratricopeptide repeat protein n=1 Tax=Thiothrix winogradskyi TaxID=96472 RepID=A0ABY3SW74_9GAMM|nr:hypothetical protein [Thiothrix winogradskyi]UJS23187.1 hypothetical protein L2Y54_14685 [Thiothrix winogradskyi]
MITSKEVFAKRKEGALDDAYQMALQLTNQSSVDDWDFKALAWCLIDLIKREVKAENQQNLILYRQQLEGIKAFPADDVLQRGIRNVLSLCNPHGQLISQAKALSKENKHEEAANLYRKVWMASSADRETQTSFGWELYKISKELVAKENSNLGIIKRNMNDYLKLDVEKPSLLHSCFLQLAAKITSQDQFNMMVFSYQWNLEYLRPEDFERYRDNNGKDFPSLAEKVIQQASKKAASSDNLEYLNYILPYVDSAINQYPDNIWLKLNKAKLLLALDKYDNAFIFGLDVVKSKINDYWAWELLGDICAGTNLSNALSCYCKALLCSTDDKFTGKVRLKLAQCLISIGELTRAKYEVERVLAFREKESQHIPEDAMRIISQEWYAATQENTSNLDYYRAHTSVAESLLFSTLQWINANVGGKFTIPGKEDKPKRKIFLKISADPIEISISESKFPYKKLIDGAGLRIKGEFDSNQRFQVYVIEERHSIKPWDIFTVEIGVIDHVNMERGVIHFIVNRNIDGVVPIRDLEEECKEGDAIAVKLFKHTSKKGIEHRVIHAAITNLTPSELIRREFFEEVHVTNGMGFTKSNIFISPPLITEYQVIDGQKISGVAILNYNRKKSSWGWRAISI